MALKGTTNGGSEREIRQPSEQASEGQRQSSSVVSSWTNFLQDTTLKIPRSPSGAILGGWMDTARQVLKTYGETTGFDFQVVPIDITEYPALAVSILVIAAVRRNDPDAGVGFHIHLLAGSVGKFAPKQMTEAGQNFQHEWAIGDAYNVRMEDIAKQVLQQRYNISLFHSGSASTIQASIKSDNQEKATLAILQGMTAAALAIEQADPAFLDLNIAKIDKTQQLISRVELLDGPVLDILGFPVRADMKLDLLAVEKNQRNDDSINLSSENEIVSVTGYVDLTWDPDGVVQQVYGQTAGAEYMYSPTMVITSISAPKPMTTGVILLAIANAYSARSQSVWTQTLNPRTQHRHPNGLNDIGALGIDLNLTNETSGIGAPFPTTSDQYSHDMFAKMMQRFVRPGLSTCIDIPETGIHSWSLTKIAFAGEESSKARKELLEAADILTNGNFSKFYNERHGTGEVLRPVENKVHQGYYTDQNGMVRSIADFDYLAILNTCAATDPTLARDWSDTFFDTENRSWEYRLARRRQILDRYTNFTFTGYAVRYMFEPVYTEALVQGCMAAGVTPVLRMPNAGQSLQARASASNYGFGHNVNPNPGFTYGAAPGGGVGGSRTGTGFARFVK